MRAPVLALACLVALSGLARADDDPKPGSPEAKKKAGDLVKEASSHWSDKDPKKCRELAEKAHELDPESFQIDAFLGSLYDVKLGEPEKALESYDRAIRSLVGATKDGEKRFKADVIARKGDVLYSYKDDLEGARTCYESSLQTVALSTTADKLSNLLHRLAGQAKDPEKKKKQNAAALEYAEKAHELVAYMTQDRNDPNHKHWLAKVKAQLSLCKETLGDKEGAEKVLKSVDADDWDEKSGYNLALLEALHGESKKAEDHLREFMKLRPTPRSRNQLRKMIKTEPDFEKLTGTASWKDLVLDEKEAAADKPEEK